MWHAVLWQIKNNKNKTLELDKIYSGSVSFGLETDYCHMIHQEQSHGQASGQSK